MLRRVVIGGCCVLALLGGTMVYRETFDHGADYKAESLLVVRPFNKALLRPAFEREIKRSCAQIRLV